MVVALLGFVSSPASAVGTGTITGKLTAPGGGGLAGVQIDAQSAPPPQSSSGSAVTDANGNFTISALPAGSYALHVHDDYSDHQWASGAKTFESAKKLTVNADATRTVAIKNWKLGTQTTVAVRPGIKSAELTITLGKSGTVNPTGKVKLFYRTGKSHKTKSVTVTNGVANVALTKLRSGEQKFSVKFVGTRLFRSSSASTTVTIN